MNPISPFEIALVETSFRRLSRHSAETASLFFTRLFHFDPLWRSLLSNDLQIAQRRFFHHLGTIVHRLDYYDMVREYVGNLVAGHSFLAESDDHIRAFGAALFWTLEKVLGDEFTPDVYAAWMTVFVNLSYDVKAASLRELAEAV